MWAIKKLNCDSHAAKEKRLLQMNELEELRNKAYDNAKIYKDKMKKWQDKKIMRREFNVGEQVLLYNSKHNSRKTEVKMEWSLHSSSKYTLWSSNLKIDYGDDFKVNGQRVKHYLGGT